MAEEPEPKQRKHSTGGYVCEFVVENEIEGEEWRQVPDSIAPGNSTFVSNKGRVKSCKGGVKTTPAPEANGYVRFGICGKHISLHRAVLAAFGVEPPSPAHIFGNHKDLNPSNNHLGNLEWVTASENRQHSQHNNTERKSSAHKRSKPVKGKRIGSEEWTSYKSAKEAARTLGVNSASITRSCRKGYKVGSYIFKFDTPNEPPLLEGEEWKRWGSGEISNVGRYKDCRGEVKTPTPTVDGYVQIKIDMKHEYIHILVAKLFLPPPGPGQTQVDHKDGKGNQWWNLRWATPFENVQHSYANPDRKSNAPQQSKKVKVQKVGTTEWQYFDSVREVARVLGLWPASIGYACHQNA